MNTEKEILLESKEREIVVKEIGPKYEDCHIQRIFPNLKKGGRYILVYDKKKLGIINYSFDNGECIITFDPKNIYL